MLALRHRQHETPERRKKSLTVEGRGRVLRRMEEEEECEDGR
jgi:hypothetical protein